MDFDLPRAGALCGHQNLKFFPNLGPAGPNEFLPNSAACFGPSSTANKFAVQVGLASLLEIASIHRWFALAAEGASAVVAVRVGQPASAADPGLQKRMRVEFKFGTYLNCRTYTVS